MNLNTCGFGIIPGIMGTRKNIHNYKLDYRMYGMISCFLVLFAHGASFLDIMAVDLVNERVINFNANALTLETILPVCRPIIRSVWEHFNQIQRERILKAQYSLRHDLLLKVRYRANSGTSTSSSLEDHDPDEPGKNRTESFHIPLHSPQQSRIKYFPVVRFYVYSIDSPFDVYVVSDYEDELVKSNIKFLEFKISFQKGTEKIMVGRNVILDDDTTFAFKYWSKNTKSPRLQISEIVFED